MTATFDEKKHKRHPKGSPQGGEFALKDAVPGEPDYVPPNNLFPPGEWDPHGKVKFWPREMGQYSGFRQDAPYGPFWKAILDSETGDELAFWFANVNGYPHHDDMLAAMMRADVWPGVMRTTEIAGYGFDVDRGVGTGRFANHQFAEVPLRHRKDIKDANEMLEARIGGPSGLRAAAYDESKHPRHPAGSPEGGEFSPAAERAFVNEVRERMQAPIKGFPPGEFAPDEKVKFWPQKMGHYSGFIQDAPYGPFWKAVYDPATGSELAFWFVDSQGSPHHGSMLNQLVNSGAELPIETETLSGYGMDVRSVDWGSPTGIGPAGVEAARRITARHRRDIRDANAMLPENQQDRALAAAAYVESQHPRNPKGDPDGGQWRARAGGRGAGLDAEINRQRAARVAERGRPMPDYFPMGQWTPDEPVKFWPNKLGTLYDRPFWKAITDEEGNELAFWFVDKKGWPHHSPMHSALGLPIGTELFSGYGSTVDDAPRGDRWDLAGASIVGRHRRDIRDAAQMLEAMRAAAFDESKHKRHPKGSPEGGEFAPAGDRAFINQVRQAVRNEGFPPGEFTPDDKVKFWPDKFGQQNGEPAWKAWIDPISGEELGFWFASPSGYPHHLDMANALGIVPPSGDETLSGPLRVSGYGQKVDADWMRQYFERDLGRNKEELQRLARMKSGNKLHDIIMNNVDEMVRRHRKDIEDAEIMANPVPLAASALNFEEDALVEATAKLQRQYEKVYRRAAKRAAAAYKAATKIVRAAAPPEDGQPPATTPQPSEIVSAAALLESFHRLTGVARRELLRQVLIALSDTGLISRDDMKLFLDLLAQQTGVQAERLVQGAQDAARAVVTQSMEEGWSVPQTADALKLKMEAIAPWQATMLARTDLIALGNGASMQRAVVLDAPDLQYKTWLATPDERTRINHRHAHGQTVPVRQPFTVGGEQILYPGDPSASDGNVINCRCTVIYSDSPFGPPGIKQIVMKGDLAVSAAAWVEADHPRDPEGTETGGQFARKETTTAKGAGRQVARHALAKIRQGLEGAVELLKEAEGKPGASDQVMGEARVPGFQFWQSADSGKWTFSGYGPWSYKNYFDTPEEVVDAALADLDANAREIEANFGKALAGNVVTKRDNPAMYAFLDAEREKNDSSPRWKKLADDWGVGQTEVVLTAAASSARGKDDVSGFFEPSSGTVYLNGEELAWKMEPDAQGENKPGMFSAGTNTAGLLRHEHSHAIWDRMTSAQRNEFLAMVPPEKETLRQLTGYAAAAKEYYDSNHYNNEDSPWQGEVFAEAIAATTDPSYRPEDWPAWVNEMGDWVQKLPARKR